ncbi:MAG: hypothetical protein HY695_22885 [Deltaproteobacteria bacterium]|nr:hypothetical protein [Deltaproteobacteria bacterium]
MRTPKARPERLRFSLREERGGTPLPVRSRRMWALGLFLAAGFVIFAGLGWLQIASMRGHEIRDLFDLTFLFFQGFWLLGWSVGVFFLGALAFLVLFHGESARLRNGQLIQTARLGPLRITTEYDLSKIRNLRLEPEAKRPKDFVRIRFDYRDGSDGLGNPMPRLEAESLIELIEKSAPGIHRVTPDKIPSPANPKRSQARSSAGLKRPAARPEPPPSLWSSSSLILIGANLIPLLGVLWFGWSLGEVMVLFWAESAVIGFWNVAKIAIVGKWAAVFAAPFFIGHFGGFMAVHFLFIYSLFIRGLNAAGPEPTLRTALVNLALPLWPAFTALFISHGVSFFTNYLGRHEYLGMNLKTQMGEPYKRIIVMHMTIIGGGFLTMTLRTPTAAVALLIFLKTAADLHAHRKERARRLSPVEVDERATSVALKA